MSKTIQIVLIVLVILGAVTPCVVYYLWRRSMPRNRAKRTLRKTPRTPIGEAPDGACAKLIGRLRLTGQTVTAPLSRRPCAYFHTQVQKGRNEGYWTIIEEEQHCVNVILEDDTGRVR